MMNILVAAATPFEIAPLRAYLVEHFTEKENGELYVREGARVRVLVTGIGLTATAFQMGLWLGREQYHLCINAGIAGAFDRQLQVGDVLQVRTETFGDLGVEEADGRHTDLFELGLLESNQTPFINGLLYNPHSDQHPFLPSANGLTINRVHGFEPSIAAIQKKYPEAQIESMEGAAFFYACLLAQVPFLEIRSISNYVEARKREGWNLPLAIEQLNQNLIEIMDVLI